MLCSANVSANVPPLTQAFLPCCSAFLSCTTLPAWRMVAGRRCPRNRQVGGSNPPSGSTRTPIDLRFCRLSARSDRVVVSWCIRGASVSTRCVPRYQRGLRFAREAPRPAGPGKGTAVPSAFIWAAGRGEPVTRMTAGPGWNDASSTRRCRCRACSREGRWSQGRRFESCRGRRPVRYPNTPRATGYRPTPAALSRGNRAGPGSAARSRRAAGAPPARGRPPHRSRGSRGRQGRRCAAWATAPRA